MELAKDIIATVESTTIDGYNNIVDLKDQETLKAQPENWSDERWQIFTFLHSPTWIFCTLFLIVLTILGLVLETDSTAQHGQPHVAVVIFNRLLILPFLGEICGQIFVYRRQFFRKGDLLSFFCVSADISVLLVDLLGPHAVPLTYCLRLMRILRILRTARVFQVIRRFPELKYLLTQMKSAFTTIFWGLIMVLLVLLMLSVFFVNVFHPLIKEMVEKDELSHLSENEVNNLLIGISSVWRTMVNLTQTLVAGDDWGSTALPVINRYAWAYFFFLVAIGVVPLCVMNLILAAIVDSGAKAREEQAFIKAAGDRACQAKERERKKEYALELFREIDEDESGFLSREELMHGYNKNTKFREVMRDMEFEEIDLEILFRVLDRNNSGCIDYNECLSAVIEAKSVSSQHVLVFIKFAVMDLWRRQSKVEDILNVLVNNMLNVQPVKAAEDPKDKPRNSKMPTGRREASPPAAKRQGSPAPARGDVSPRNSQKKDEPAAKHGNSRGTKQTEEDKKQKGHVGSNGSMHNNRMSNRESLRSLAIVNGSGGGPVSIGTQTSVSNLSDDANVSVVGEWEVARGKGGPDQNMREDSMLSMQSLASSDFDIRHVVLDLSYQTKKMVEQSQAQTLSFSRLDERISAVLDRLQLPLPNKTSTLL